MRAWGACGLGSIPGSPTWGSAVHRTRLLTDTPPPSAHSPFVSVLIPPMANSRGKLSPVGLQTVPTAVTPYEATNGQENEC